MAIRCAEMKRLLRKLVPSRPSISRDEAIEIARRECEKRGWVWAEPTAVRWGLRKWTVWTNADGIGSNAVFSINRSSGTVEAARFLRR